MRICSIGLAELLHGHRHLELLLQLLDGFVVFVLIFLQGLNLSVASFDFLVDELHTLAYVLSAFLQFLADQHGTVQLENLEWD